jgi:hypothetical protein
MSNYRNYECINEVLRIDQIELETIGTEHYEVEDILAYQINEAVAFFREVTYVPEKIDYDEYVPF